jgi:Na+/melibiose symporter-like transporter
MPVSRNVVSVILQTTFIVIFISIFFFIYTSQIEHAVVVSQVDNLVLSFTEDLDLVASDEQKQTLRDFFKNLQPPDMKEEDSKAAANNKDLEIQTIKLVAIIFFIGISICIGIIVYFNLNFWDLIKESIAGLVAVIFIELIFMTYFVKNYRSLDPNIVKLHIIEILQDYAGTPKPFPFSIAPRINQ